MRAGNDVVIDVISVSPVIVCGDIRDLNLTLEVTKVSINTRVLLYIRENRHKETGAIIELHPIQDDNCIGMKRVVQIMAAVTSFINRDYSWSRTRLV